MSDELERILARVASGALSPEDAEPLVAAAAAPRPSGASTPTSEPAATAARVVHIQVTDGDREVVDLRVPMSLASLAGSVIPGLADPQIARLQQAIRDGETGTILDVRDADGSGVRIATE
jgi:hypothetical protein